MTGPAADPQGAPDGRATGTTASGPGPGSASPRSTAGKPGSGHRLTLVTGDRVTVDAKGRVTGFRPAKGREHIPVRTRSFDGHTLVLPYDAQRLIRAGKVDQRLFDVTELSRKAHREARKNGLKLIVGYRGTAARDARADVRAAGDTAVRRTFTSLNADAVTTPERDAAALWKALTDERGTTAAGVGRLWLDGIRRVSLDKSVKQVGVPKAWEAGYDGKGVRIAVLDTGVDATHPDLKEQVVGAKNFTPSPDADDRYGHGTHVASIAAGTGAKNPAYKGVAPGAKVLSGKVLGDDGRGSDSGIIAGIDWAAAQGADVVNMSLGGGDTPGVDPVEAAINKVSAEKGILFAVAAGNAGDPGSLNSPGSADAALTVGAVDDNDKLAPFSSQGPRVGDGAIKPDVTAPGVGITAAAAPGSEIEKEVGQKPEGYLTISGTSMATPHAAGAAALLKQQHPDWKQPELKGALTASTKAGTYTAFQQGSGRIAVDRAIKQTVIADPVSLNYGTQLWPHTDDKPVTKKVTYKNLGTKDVTLDLTVSALDPKGRPAPTGFFTLGAKKVTVPAGGTASVDLTADTRLGGTVDGSYSAYIVANGGGQSVRTAAAVDREVESYDVTLKSIGRDGRPTPHHETMLSAITGAGTGTNLFPHDPSGTVTVRVTKGSYLLDSAVYVDPQNGDKGIDWLVRPELTVDRKLTVTLDARKARPVDITVPDRGAKLAFMDARYTYQGYEMGALRVSAFQNMRTAHLGPAVPDGLGQQWLGTWRKGADTAYEMFLGGEVTKLATGFVKHLKPTDFATVKVRMGASSANKKGILSAAGYLPDVGGISMVPPVQKLPRTKTLHLSALGKVTWGLNFEQYGGVDEEGNPLVDAYYWFKEPRAYKAGRSYQESFGVGVFGPRVGAGEGVFRDGSKLYGDLPLFADGKGNAGWTDLTSVKTELYRDGRKVGANEDPLSGEDGAFDVPDADAAYRLTTSVKRSAALSAASTRVDASWTFRSERGGPKQLPVSTARFAPRLDLTSRAPAGRTQRMPVTVQGAAAGANLKSLHVWASYDSGRTWKELKVTDGRVTVKNPAAGKGISFRAKITDRKGNESTLSVLHAYYGT
ncbi:S8 family peptidase [Streptomyces flavofungini]|uniref:S8 family peptidase n=1 Tax=Streptomyces flavofungini TaxID=68200 RepID=UPI0025B1C579|nr:S8 family serine peptidase [Streptomyces flavofungini]WJV51148.1 S8 family serine peptidase [Streptomyces flavofungini]